VTWVNQNDIASVKNESNSNGLVMSREGQSVVHPSPAPTTSEITELADVYFFRPLGLVLARLANKLRMTPTQVTAVGAVIGVVGGAMLYFESLGLIAFALLIVHGVVDSADGQLARMTDRVSEFGRVLDGASGYVTHVSIYLAIAGGVSQRSGNLSILLWLFPAGIANVIQAQMYEYFRPLYVQIVEKGQISQIRPAAVPPWIRWLYRGYLVAQRSLTGLHPRVEARVSMRAVGGCIQENDRIRYRRCFYRITRAWGLLGDNTRFYIIGLLACVHRTDLFFAIVFGPMNLVLIVLWFWQRQADHRFLATD